MVLRDITLQQFRVLRPLERECRPDEVTRAVDDILPCMRRLWASYRKFCLDYCYRDLLVFPLEGCKLAGCMLHARWRCTWYFLRRLFRGALCLRQEPREQSHARPRYVSINITGSLMKQDQILLVKMAKYIGFRVYRRSY